VLTDFGMCFDLRKNRIVDFKVSPTTTTNTAPLS